MGWLAYPGNTSIDPSSLTVYVVLADKKALGIVQTSTPSVNFNSTIQELASAIKEGKLPLQIQGSNVWIKSLDYCSDKSCKESKSLAISDKPPKFPPSKGVVMGRGFQEVLGITALVMVLMYKL